MRTLAQDLPTQIGRQVIVRGWLNNIRSLGKISFLLLRDRSGLMQVVMEKGDELAKVESLQPGSILRIQGHVAPSQSSYKAEITHPRITVENPIVEVPPVDYYKPEIQSDLEFILDHRPISLRNRKIAAVFRIQSQIAHAY